MDRVFRGQMTDPEAFVVTVELVLAPEADGAAIKAAKGIAADALKDGRVAAVSITDNPGGNASLGPDVLGREIMDLGMDVLIHMTCRDLNRAGLESRALQLSRMGLRNILALTGDFPGAGYAGKGQPVFDLDAVTLLGLLRNVDARTHGDPPEDGFYLGCGVSPFKATEAECVGQYNKLRLKHAMGAEFVITQLGYDARKFQELLQMQRTMGIRIPTLASVYHLTRGAAKVMHAGGVPGAVVTSKLLEQLEAEAAQGKDAARDLARERTARLAAVVKGLGYKGVHIGGFTKGFGPIDGILTRMAEIEDRWEEFLPDLDNPQPKSFYMFQPDAQRPGLSIDKMTPRTQKAGVIERLRLGGMSLAHNLFFRLDSPLAPFYRRVAALLDKTLVGRRITTVVERAMKSFLFSCRGCGDCALQHIGFFCPESQCAKHTRNGPCGDSCEGHCGVYSERMCVWVKAYNRLATEGKGDTIATEIVAPRMWTCDGCASWLNFHLQRDHQSLPPEVRKVLEPLPEPAEVALDPNKAEVKPTLQHGPAAVVVSVDPAPETAETAATDPERTDSKPEEVVH